MRILVVDNSLITYKNGGYYTNAMNGHFLDELKVSNEITYFQFATKSGNDINSYDLCKNGINVIPVKYGRFKLLSYLCCVIKFILVLFSFDYVHLYYPNSLRILAIICKIFRKPYGIYLRGMTGVFDKFSYIIYKSAQGVYTVSDLFTDNINEYLKRGVAHTIRPMISYDSSHIVFNRQYLSPDKFEFLYLGRLSIDKGLLELVTALELLKSKGYTFHLRIVGDGAYSSELKEIVHKKRLDSVISFEGPVYDNRIKSEYYKTSDVYILPSYHEGFPRTLYEAMIFGTPIITTFVGGISGLMRDRVNCIEIKPRSIHSIEKQLVYAMDNYDQMINYALNARDLVCNVLSNRRISHAGYINKVNNVK